jgi:hypothetical protein
MSGSSSNSINIRHAFIGMLFALVVVTSAQKISEIIFLLTEGWMSMPSIEVFQYNDWFIASALSHEALVVFLVASSWVGWSKSLGSNGGSEQYVSVHGVPFILLLLEVLLVTLYFSMSAANELSTNDHIDFSLTQFSEKEASARPEALILFFIFIVYLIWDYFNDIILEPLEGYNVMWRTLANISSGPIVFCFSSIISCIMSVVVFYFLSENSSPVIAILGDLALMMVVLFFYKSKCFEGYLLSLFFWESSRKFDNREPPEGGQVFVAFVIFIIYIITLLGVCQLHA